MIGKVTGLSNMKARAFVAKKLLPISVGCLGSQKGSLVSCMVGMTPV